MIESARYEQAGTIAAVIDGEQWSGICDQSRFWADIQSWIGAGNAVAPYEPPPGATRWQVGRRTIIKRLAEAGKLEAAEAALNAAGAETRWRWNTVDVVGGVFNDDPATRALLQAIGADPTAVLAPE